MLNHEVAKNSEDILIVQAPLYFNSEAFPRELINHGEHAKLAPVTGFVLNKIISPDMVAMLWTQPHTRAIVQPQASAFRLFYRYFQALALPDARHTFVVYMPAVSSQQGANPLVTVPAIAGRQFNDGEGQRIFIVSALWLAPLR